MMFFIGKQKLVKIHCISNHYKKTIVTVKKPTAFDQPSYKIDS